MDTCGYVCMSVCKREREGERETVFVIMVYVRLCVCDNGVYVSLCVLTV